MTQTKQNWIKRIIAVLMVLVMCFGVLPMGVFAADEEVQQCAKPIINTEKLTYYVEGYLYKGNIRGNSDNDSTCTYYYTVDGSIPSATNGTKIKGTRCASDTTNIISSAKLKGATTNSDGNAVLKIVATKEGYKDSEVTEFEYKVCPESITPFVDANLKKAVLEALNKASADVTTLITKEEMADLTELDLSQKDISGLYGLSSAVNVKSIDLSGNNASIDASLSELLSMTNLEKVDISDCGITSAENMLELLKLSKLDTFDASGNNIAGYFTLPEKANVSAINVSDNLLSGVNGGYTTANYPNLKTLNMDNNLMDWNEVAENYETLVIDGKVNVICNSMKNPATLHRVWYEGVSGEPSLDADIDQKTRTVSFTILGDNVNIAFISGTAVNTAKVTIGEEKVTVLSYSNTYSVGDGTYKITGLQEGSNKIPVSVMYQDGSTMDYTLDITSLKYIPVENSDEFVYIKDSVIYRTLCNKLGKNYTDNYQITRADLSKITGNLTIPVCSDLSWLQYCVNITGLFVRDTVNGYLMRDYYAGTYETVPDLSGLTKLTTLVLNSNNLKEVPNLSGLTSLTRLYVSATVDGKLPDVSGLTNLKEIAIARSKGNMPAGLNSLTRENFKVYLNNNPDASFNLSNQNLPVSMTALEVNNTGATITIGDMTGGSSFTLTAFGGADKIVFTHPNTVPVTDLYYNYYTGSTDGFPDNMNQITSLKRFTLFACNFKEVNWNDSFNNMTNLETVSFFNSGLTEMPKWLATATNLTSISLSSDKITNFDVDLSDLNSLTTLECSFLKFTSLPDANYLPVSLSSLNLQSNNISNVDVDYSKLVNLKTLNLKFNYLYEFPAFIKDLKALETLEINQNYYDEIPENAFGDLDNLTKLTIGDYVPAVKNGYAYSLAEGTTTANEIERLKTNVEANEKTLIVSVIGQEGKLADLARISVGDDLYYEDYGLFNVELPEGTTTISLNAQAIYPNTKITIGDKTVTGSGVFELDLQDGFNEFLIRTHIDENDVRASEGTDKEYTLKIYCGAKSSIETMEVGKYYEVDCVIYKYGTQNPSMAAGYFSDKAQIRQRVDGKYEVYLTCNRMSWVNTLSTYGEDGKRYDADIISQDAENDILKVRAIMDSLPVPFKLNMYVVPMGYYPDCEVYLDLTSMIDITDQMPSVDTVDLNAAYNEASVITAKRNIYTDDSYKALADAVASAKAVLDNNNSSQEEIDAAKETLSAALDGLKVDETKLADKTELNQVIAEAKALAKGNHTTAAWNALQDAIADAQAVCDTLEASQSEVNTAKKSLSTAVTLFNNSGSASELDKDNLEDGVYSVYVDMIKTDRSSKSMADNAINHTVKLEVVNGEYFITLDFKGLNIEGSFGYLEKLSYYADGYTYGQWGTVEGTLVDAEVLTVQKDADGNVVVDQYNNADKPYPDLVKVKVVSTAIADEDGYAALHVFVPIMEAIAEGNGDQDVLMQIDWSTLKLVEADAPIIMPFTDVDGHWAYDAISYAYGNGIMNGMTNTTFEPEGNLTRAQLATILWRLDGSAKATAADPYSDISSHWAKEAILWATENEIVNGMGNGTFAPDAFITREQIATMIYRYAEYKGYDVSKAANLGGYSDVSAVDSWALAAMQWANGEGLITGRTANTLCPDETAKRGEIATIMQRFMENIVK